MTHTSEKTGIIEVIEKYHDHHELMVKLAKIFIKKRLEVEAMVETPASERPTLVTHPSCFPALNEYDDLRSAVIIQMRYIDALIDNLLSNGGEDQDQNVLLFNAVTILHHLTGAALAGSPVDEPELTAQVALAAESAAV